MKTLLSFISILLLLSSCYTDKPTQRQSYAFKKLETRDYVTVGTMFDTIEPPYIIDLQNVKKHLMFIGNDHNNDPSHKQYAIIEDKFTKLQPQIAFNEGGQIPESLHYSSKEEAISKNGTTGFLKFLSDRANIRVVDGDTDEGTEFPIMLKKYPKDKLFLYYIMERLVIPYINGAHKNMTFEELYQKAVAKWFVERGFPLSEKEQSIAYFKELYKSYMGVPFIAELNKNIEKFDYINGGGCEFCAIGRSSKMLRDSILLDKIDKSLYKYDRVIVTFGHGHALAVEPALRQIVSKKR